MTALAGESQKIFMVAIPAFHPGKAVVQIATFQVAGNDLLKVGPARTRIAFRTSPRKLAQRFQNGPPRTGNNRRIGVCEGGKWWPKQITWGIGRI